MKLRTDNFRESLKSQKKVLLERLIKLIKFPVKWIKKRE